jgi:hypothetical protein
VLAEEIAEDLHAALEQFSASAEKLNEAELPEHFTSAETSCESFGSSGRLSASGFICCS